MTPKTADGKKTIVIIISALVICLLIAIVITTVIVPKLRYNASVRKYGQEMVESFYALEKRDEITFGVFEQDNDTSDGKEEIEWIVLATEDNRVLLISKYALDCMPYEDTKPSTDWESSSLREWLNGAFLAEAFGEAGRDMVLTAVSTKDEPYGAAAGPSGDAVFLLSVQEADGYLWWNKAKSCLPTEYAKARGADIEIDGSCTWWLRSQGLSASFAARINTFGGTDIGGVRIDNGHVAVRPALWISVLA